ncbi:MAG: hypothetical protein GEU95_01190 [Rhizobiales bacterium]|nr:hypothetical protein [Hyphomicrobiales bacterium]
MAKRDDLNEDLGLTEDERAALEEGEAEDAATAKAEGDATAFDFNEAKGAVKDDAKADDKADAKPEPAADAKADDKKADDKPAEAKGDDAAKTDAANADDGAEKGDGKGADAKTDTKPDTEARAPRQAVPAWTAPADAEAQLTQLATERDQLAERFDNGEITAKELLSKQAEIASRERKIERDRDRAEMASEMATAVWTQTTVPTFLDAHPHYRNNQTLNGMLDAEVRRLQVAAMEAGKDQLDPSILIDADANIAAALAPFGVKPKVAASAAADAGKTAAPAGKPEIPPTLGTLPATEITGTGDGKYASLDRLAEANPIAFEDALAKLPEAEREAYLRAH